MKSVITLFFMLSYSAAADSNDVMKACLETYEYSVEKFDEYDFSKAAACHSDYRVMMNEAKLDELRDFLKHNPRYRVPGQSLNRCWGKPREMPFESSYIKKTKEGFEAGVNYKDKLPAGCYENAPWDNRDEK